MQYLKNNMKSGVDYHLYNSSYHKQKSAIYSYKANSYLNDCGHNIAKIAFNTRFIGLATCAFLLVAASFIPVLHTPTVSYLANHTIALISQDPAFIFTGAIFSSGHSYSILDKLRVFGTTLMLLDRCQHGFKIAKCFLDNTKNLAVYTGYQCLSWGEYFKSVLSDFFNIQKENDEILDKIPQEKVIVSKDLAKTIAMHQQYIDVYSEALRSTTKDLSKDIALEGAKLLGIASIMSSVLFLGNGIQPFAINGLTASCLESYRLKKPFGMPSDTVLSKKGIIGRVISSPLSNTIKIIGLVGSVSPLFSSDYVQRYCNGNVFSIKSANYHLAQYASREIYNKFINALGTAVILSSSFSALIAYHSMALYKAKWQQAHEQSKAKIVLEDTKVQKELVEEPTASESDILPEVEMEDCSGIELFAELPEAVECSD